MRKTAPNATQSQGKSEERKLLICQESDWQKHLKQQPDFGQQSSSQKKRHKEIKIRKTILNSTHSKGKSEERKWHICQEPDWQKHLKQQPDFGQQRSS